MNRQTVGRSLPFAFALWAVATAVSLQTLGFALASPVQAKTISINADGTGDYPTIGAAVAAAHTGDVIVLKQGVYFGLNNWDVSFSGKALTVCSQDPNNPTVVTNTVIDCEGSRTPWATHWAIGIEGDSSTHLTLAGVTVGNAFDVGAGGALRADGADLDVINCTFEDNESEMQGGAVFCNNNHARFVGCTFSNSVSDTLHGGTLYATGSQLDFMNCSFQDSGGCAIETYDCQVTSTGCSFQNNKGQDGGAIHSHADTAPASTTLSLSRCTFSANSASTCGGALYNYGAQVTISACTFSVNAASQDGGAIYNYRSSPTTTSCLFVGNTATGTGGAIQNVSNSSPDIHNCTFVGNGASTGGAVAAKGGSNPLISHCILWNNTATQAPSVYLGTYTWSPVQTSQATVEFCDVDGGRGSTYAEAGCTLAWDSAHNINRDPLFVGAATGDYHLSPDSPCINAGDPTYVPKSGQTDLDGTPRLMGSSVDLGAYEFQGLGPVYRFWSATEGRHFYTISSTERDQYLARPSDWQLECVAFYAFYVPALTNLKPVYRFVAPSVDSHFYTISEDERQRVQKNWPDYWTYEGVAFYAYPAGQQPFGALPVYRFWSDYLGSHFYTIDENEKNRVIQNYPGIWQFEGIAWYAYNQPSLPGNASYNFAGGSQGAAYSFTLSATVDGKDAQISAPTVKFATSSTLMQMALDFNKQTTTLANLQVQTAATTSNATIQQTGSGVSLMIALSVQASFAVSKPQGPYSIDPTTGVFADYTKSSQNILAQDPVFKYSGSVQFSGQSKDFNVQTTATQLELSASGTFENMNLLPDEIDAQMPSTFQWHRQGVKDLLVSASVNGHTVQLYVTSVDVSTQGVWKGKLAQ